MRDFPCGHIWNKNEAKAFSISWVRGLLACVTDGPETWCFIYLDLSSTKPFGSFMSDRVLWSSVFLGLLYLFRKCSLANNVPQLKRSIYQECKIFVILNN